MSTTLYSEYFQKKINDYIDLPDLIRKISRKLGFFYSQYTWLLKLNWIEFIGIYLFHIFYSLTFSSLACELFIYI